MINVLVLYHEDISQRFPAHYRMPFLDLMPSDQYNVRFICPDSRSNGIEKKNKIITIPRKRGRGLTGIPFEYFRNRRILSRSVEEVIEGGFIPDFIFTFGYPWLLLMGEKLRRRFGSLHFTVLGHLFCESKLSKSDIIEKIKGLGCYHVRKKVYNRADCILATSQEMNEYFSNLFRNTRIVTWPAGVDTNIEIESLRSQRNKIRKKLGIGESDIIGIYIGTIDSQRDLKFVLRSLNIARKIKNRLKLFFLGYSGSVKDRYSLETYAKKIGVSDHIILHSAVPEDDLPLYMASADFGLSPFKPTFVLRHNSPLKLAEYMRTALPVLATDIPDQREILNESKCGILTDWNENAYADSMIKIAMMTVQQRREMGERGRVWVQANRDVKILTWKMITWMEEAMRMHA